MTLTVRLPERVEQELAEYCARKGINRSQAVKEALALMLEGDAREPSAYDLGKDLFGPQTDKLPPDDVALHSKRLLRERLLRKSK